MKSINRILCYAYGSGSDTVTQINLPEGLESLGSHAFENFNALESVTRIRDFAFSECTSLASVILPTSLKTLDGNAFSYCSSLVEVTIPYGTESVGGTFMECPNLQAHLLPLLRAEP